MRPRSTRLFAAAALVLCLVALPIPIGAQAGADAARPAPSGTPNTEDDAVHLETLDFPARRMRESLRLQLDSRLVPDAGAGSGHLTEYQTDLRARLTLPVNERVVVRFSARAGMSHYSFRGDVDPFFDDNLDVYRVRLGAQGGYLLNPEGWSLFRDGEAWSLLGGLQGSSDFESGEFEEGASVLGGLTLGYELPNTLSIAVGAGLATSPNEGGLDVSPILFARWNVTERITLRSRGLGAQLEYQWSPRLELFATAFRSTDKYALKPRDATFLPASPTPRFDDLALNDRMLLTGVGFEWRFSKSLRLNTEVGAVAWRRLRVRSDDYGTLVSRSGDPAAYLEVRLEVRP